MPTQITIDDVPEAVKRAIIREYFRKRMSALGRKRSPKKRAAVTANLAKVNARRTAGQQAALKEAFAEFDRGVPASKAYKTAKMHYSKFVAALKRSGRDPRGFSL